MSDANHKPQRFDLAALRARLEAAPARDPWRSLDELADTPEFREFLQREFPPEASEWHDPIGRRRFLQLMAASLALAGLSACTRQPAEKIIPYVRAPEEIIPGKPLYYATAMTLGGYALGVLAESHMGRPTKIEGNELHPASLGSTDAFAQASILTLYDPDRSQVVQEAGRISTWSAFLAALTRALQTEGAQRGRGLRLLTETITSPTLAAQIRALLAAYPEAQWHTYEPAHRDNARAGAVLAFGSAVETHYRLDRADVILSLDSDFLSCGPASVRYARDFTDRRRIGRDHSSMNRLYVAEAVPTNTGAMADHRLRVASTRVEAIARAVAIELGLDVDAPGDISETEAKWARAVARDLAASRRFGTGSSVAIAGDTQPPAVHALAHAINHTLGSAGSTVVYTDPVDANPVDQTESLRALTADMDAGRVELLVILGGNPVYNAPVDLGFAERLQKVPLRVHLSLYEDETSYLCHWHIPETHYLEAWGDARAFDGTVTIQQPLIAPLYGGKSACELVSALAGQPNRTGHDIVRDYWKARSGASDFEAFWQRSVHDGVVAGSALPERKLSLRRDFSAAPPASPAAGLEINFRTDPTIYDGRFANNGWLQELPKALTRLTWDNAVLVSPATAARMGISSEDVLELRYRDRTLHCPAWISPGQADDSVTVFLGYGRARAGRVGSGVGFNTYALRGADAPWFERGLEIRNTGNRYPLATTQHHHTMDGRPLVRAGALEDYLHHPHMFHEMAHEPPPGLTLYPGFRYQGYAWGMAIDLSACTGCNACVVACQAENNIPVVGKDQVARGREMHWLRIDRYYHGGLENPEVYHQPVPCMHCENAPCEVVCPVAATVHSDEGLNDMVYNRCVGTRYCSNNCPYKVRRFNFLLYSDLDTPSLKAMRNPDVTVRSRGVMEKCTYCVQRINAARIDAEKEGRQIRDGEIVTACQQACPSHAIVFGDINDPKSRVAQLKGEARNYALLADLNTRPRTTYLARLRNPNPELEQT